MFATELLRMPFFKVITLKNESVLVKKAITYNWDGLNMYVSTSILKISFNIYKAL